MHYLLADEPFEQSLEERGDKMGEKTKENKKNKNKNKYWDIHVHMYLDTCCTASKKKTSFISLDEFKLKSSKY